MGGGEISYINIHRNTLCTYQNYHSAAYMAFPGLTLAGMCIVKLANKGMQKEVHGNQGAG